MLTILFILLIAVAVLALFTAVIRGVDRREDEDLAEAQLEKQRRESFRQALENTGHE